jgi:osmoprotectant transport system ATP-binding protein
VFSGRVAARAVALLRAALRRLYKWAKRSTVIEARGLTKRFGEATVVDGISFHVAEGELLALVGESGSGKTTTLKMLNRLIEPSAGSVHLWGADVRQTPAHLLRRGIGYAFQRVGLFPHMTVEENIAVTPKLLGWSEKVISERVLELLELVELEPEVRSRWPASLSGGQAQRVGVARALAARPRLMLLDEPFGALDPLTRDRLQQSFHELQRELKLTVIFVTHDMAEALSLADRIAVLRAGRIVQVGTPAELLAEPASAYVDQLLDTPRRQAAVFERLARGALHG